jgi:hypothetical protein
MDAARGSRTRLLMLVITLLAVSAAGIVVLARPAFAASPVATQTAVSYAPNPATAGQTVTLTATVSDVPSPGPVPTGTVLFQLGGTTVGAGPVTLNSSGVATTTTTFAAGTQFATIQVTYTPADPNAFYGSSTAVFVIVTTPVNSSIPLAVTVPPYGLFTLTVDTTDVVNLAVSGNDATGTLTPVVVSDTRNTYPGWSVSGQAGPFTGSGSAAGASVAGDQLGWTPTDTSVAGGVTLGSPVSPASPGLGTTPAVLAQAHAGTGFGTSSLGANLELLLPAETAAGPYAGGLTVSAVTALP